MNPFAAQLPSLPRPHVSRPALVERVLAARVICLEATAGYGKTALLVEAAQRSGNRRAWYAVSLADRDPAHLVAGLFRAAGAAPPAAGADPALAMKALVRWLAAAEPVTVALDDLHLLTGAGDACRLLGDLVANAPPTARIVLAGRSRLPIPSLPRLRLQGELLELGPSDLRFSLEETRTLIDQLMATDQDPADLHQRARGWPAALRLLAEAEWGPDGPSYAGLSAYVAAEILDSLSEEQRTFLLAIAVLDEWTPAACDWLLEQPGTERELAWVQALGPEAVLRECLRHELRRDPERYLALQRRASLYEWGRGRLEAALRHAVESGDPGLIAPLLQQEGARLLQSGRLADLEGWLEAVPTSVLELVPDLLRQSGEALRRAGRPRRSVRWLHQAALGYAAGNQAGGLLRTLCRLAAAHGDLGQWGEAKAALRQVEEELALAAGVERAEALLTLGEYLSSQGDGEKAARSLREAVELFRQYGDAEGMGTALLGLGAHAMVALGQPEAALTAVRQAQELVSGAAACDALLAEVELLLGLGRWEAARRAIDQAVPGSAPQEALLSWVRARLSMQQEDFKTAAQLCEQGDRYITDTDHTPALTCASLVAKGWLAHLSGDQDAALALARQARRLSEAAGVPLLKAAAQALSGLCLPPEPAGRERIRVNCFGPFRMFRGEAEVPLSTWSRAQVRGIFQVLLLQPGYTASRELLLESFWPEEEPELSRARLRVALNRLRTVLHSLDAGLESGPDWIRLQTGAIGWVDLEVFRTHLASARQSVVTDPLQCLEHCRAGRALVTGELLPEAFWTWAEDHRRRVQREVLELLWLWRDAAIRAERTDEAIAALEELLALEPSQEEAARQLMQLLIRRGRRGEALQHYRRLARWLKQELGLDPAPETRRVLSEAIT